MKVVLEKDGDCKFVNWAQVSEHCVNEFKRLFVAALDCASAELKELKPGETRMIPIEFPSIEISRSGEEVNVGLELVK